VKGKIREDRCSRPRWQAAAKPSWCTQTSCGRRGRHGAPLQSKEDHGAFIRTAGDAGIDIVSTRAARQHFVQAPAEVDGVDFNKKVRMGIAQPLRRRLPTVTAQLSAASSCEREAASPRHDGRKLKFTLPARCTRIDTLAPITATA